MKKLHKLGSFFRGLAVGLAVLACVPLAKANPSDYFTTSVANNGTYYWDLANWSTASGGPFNQNFVTTNFARFTGGSGSTYTIVVSNLEQLGGSYDTVAATVIITNSPTGGGINITPNGATSMPEGGFPFLLQGFLSVGTTTFACPISGTGGFESESGGGHLQLFGTNNFTGGFLVSSSSMFVDFNNTNSFGNGPICFGATFALFENEGPTSLDITNNVIIEGGAIGIDFLGTVTMGGNWNINSQSLNLRNGTVLGTSAITIGGIMSNTTGTVTYSSQYTNSILLTNNNTYAGETILGYQAENLITLEIAATGSIASTIVSNTGSGSILKLDGPTCLNTNATLELPASPAAGSVNLNFNSGTQQIASLFFGGALQPSGTYGSSTSGAVNQSATFAGNGVLLVGGKPIITQQPVSEGRFVGATASFTVASTGTTPFSYYWRSNGTVIAGGPDTPTYTINPVTTAASYSVIVSNSFGSVTSSVAQLALVASNNYAGVITGDSPISYWRLDETSGNTAYDCVGNNNGFFTNVLLGQPGCFLGLDPDTAISLPGASPTAPSFVNVTNYSAFNWSEVTPPGAFNQLTVEGWVLFTNLNGTQRILSCGSYYGGGWGYGISGGSALQFTTFGDIDYTFSLASPLSTNVWYYVAVTYDVNNNFNFYLNGNLMGSLPDTTLTAKKAGAVTVPLCIGGNGTGYWSPFSVGTQPTFYEEVEGSVDEVAVYNTALSGTQVGNHFSARFGSGSLPITTAPNVSPTTNYATLSATFTEVAGGPSLSYQWYGTTNGLIPGATSSSFVLTPLAVTNTDLYYCQVTNPAGMSNSTTVLLTVLPIPTNASQLNLTNGLVLHMPFDGDLTDVSGRNHNGTKVGAPYFTNGIIGSNALHYYTDTNAATTNYVTLGGPISDLQFSSNISFTVSMWVREAGGSDTNLPFFTDATATSGFTPGYTFAPYDRTNNGGNSTWVASIGGTSTISIPNGFDSFSPGNAITDGNYHNLIFVANRTGSLTCYVDGTQVDAESDSYAGSITTANATVIGQDAVGQYAVTGAADIDDLCVWTTPLTQLQVSGIYLGGSVNGISVAPSGPVALTLTVTNNAGQFQLVWPTGATANIEASTNIFGPYTNFATGVTSPYNISTSGTALFYKLHP